MSSPSTIRIVDRAFLSWLVAVQACEEVADHGAWVILSVIVDLRAGSPSFGKWYGAELNEDNRERIVVRAEKKMRICPSCLQKSELIHYTGAMARYNRLAICQRCEKEFRY